MAAIDVGMAATNRGSTSTGGTTRVNKGNPANESGIITSVEIWANVEMVNVEVATFYVVSGDNLSTRDTHSIGTVSAGSKQTFSGLSIDVEAGDYLGIYFSSTFDKIEADSSGGDGTWTCSGDQIPCSNVTFVSQTGRVISLYGIGATPAEGSVIIMGANF